MAIYEKNGVLNYLDADGNQNILYPVTKTDDVDGLDEELAKKVNVADVVNNLTSTDTSKPLSAYQGKLLNEKLSKVYRPCGSVANYKALPTNAQVGDVYNLLDTGVNYAWTGTEWDSLAGIIDTSNFVAKDDIVDNLTTDDSTKVLSAKQGKNLKYLIDNIDLSNYATKTYVDEQIGVAINANY